MPPPQLDPKMVRVPAFAGGTWLNTPYPLEPQYLRGRSLLVDFWDYTCLNCIRTLPYLTRWYSRYHPMGLEIVGIHAPEFAFARDRAQIEDALARFGIGYPVLLDNDYVTWDRFANRAWPTKYLIDPDGYIRFRVQGEGYYQETERAIQAMLREQQPDLSLPDVLPLLRPEDAPGAVCYPTTPELYAGHQRGALGNVNGYVPYHPIVYQMPRPDERTHHAFYAEGIWKATEEAFAFAGQDGGRIILPYRAVEVNAVLSPSSDPVEVMLHLGQESGRRIVEVRQDGRYLTPENAGEDIEYDDGGLSYLTISSPRMLKVVRNASFGAHELELTFRGHGLALYSFTFTSCIVPGESWG